MSNRRFGLPVAALGLLVFAAASSPAQECDPQDPGTPPSPGMTCQLTDEPPRTFAAQVMNARKGDVLLVAACGGPVRVLFKALHPPQTYTHEAIMLEDFTELAHSTNFTERQKDRDNMNTAGLDGIHARILQFGLPGGVVESVSEAFGGIWYRDPEYPSKIYLDQAFSIQVCDEDIPAAGMLVLKPRVEQTALRSQLEAAAESARRLARDRMSSTYHSHYRPFGFSQGIISFDPEWRAANCPACDPLTPGERLCPDCDPLPGSFTASTPGQWYDHTRATVSTTFIWTALKEAGITLEGPLEPAEQGLWSNEHAADGLYVYSADNRSSAGQALYTNIYNKAVETASGFPDFIWANLDDAADDVANQVANCFAFDWCAEAAKDSDAWRNPGQGFSVSPDNMRDLWDVWDGYNEPIAPAPGGTEWIYRWASSTGTGSVSGRVQHRGAVVGGATVELKPGTQTTTDTQGRFAFPGVGAERYRIRAVAQVLGQPMSGVREVQLGPGGAIDAQIEVGQFVLATGHPSTYLLNGVVVYRGSDDAEVHQIFQSEQNSLAVNNWADQNLSQATGGGLGARQTAGDPVGIWWDGNNNKLHVFYRDPDGRVLFFYLREGVWNWGGDLTLAAGAPLAAGDPTAYVTGHPRIHVVYRDQNGHIQNIGFAAGETWGAADLTTASGAVAAAGEPSATAFGGSDTNEWVVYRSADNHIRVIPRRHGTYFSADLTAETGAPFAAGDPQLYVEGDETVNVVYRDLQGHIQKLSIRYDGAGGWRRTDISIDVPNSVGTGRPAACSNCVGPQVFARTEAGHILALSASGGLWSGTDLTSSVGAPEAAEDPTAVWIGHHQVLYRGFDEHVYRIWDYPAGDWHWQDLTNAARRDHP